MKADGSGAPGESEIEDQMLPAGPAVVATTAVPTISSDPYAAIEKWTEAQGVTPGEAPWVLHHDPADHPDPNEWRTEIYWPLAR